MLGSGDVYWLRERGGTCSLAIYGLVHGVGERVPLDFREGRGRDKEMRFGGEEILGWERCKWVCWGERTESVGLDVC